MKNNFYKQLFTCIVLTCYAAVRPCSAQTPEQLKARTPFLGTWIGVIRQQNPDSGTFHTTPVIWRIHHISNKPNVVFITQVSNYNDPVHRKVGTKFRVFGYVDNVGATDCIVLNIQDSIKNICQVGVVFNRTESGGKSYLNAGLKSRGTRCFSTMVSLRKMDDDTTEYPNSASSAANITAAQTARLVPTTGKRSGSISKKDITLPTDKAFKWYPVAAIPPAFAAAMEKIPYFKTENLGDHVRELVKDSCEVKIAAIDMDNDGVYGFLLWSVGRFCCGSKGCSYEFYENGGTKIFDITDDDITPAQNGLRSSSNLLFKLMDNRKLSDAQRAALRKDFQYEVKVYHVPLLGPGSGGGGTPDELGRILLRALQTNNEALWMSCTNPESTVVDESFSRKRFKEFRDWLEQDGVSDWSKARFSRVTFSKQSPYTSDNGEANGDQVRRDFVVEFYYGEFLGGFGSMTISTSHGGKKFLIWWPGKDTGLRRRPTDGSKQ